MRSQVIQHIKTERHKSKQQLSELYYPNIGALQTLLSNCPQTDYFAIDLCNAFLLANIPMEKLGNTQLKTFLEKYSKNVIPTPSNIRNNYITLSYEKKLINLRLAVANHPSSVSFDETTDVCRRYVANKVLKNTVTGKNTLHLPNNWTQLIFRRLLHV